MDQSAVENHDSVNNGSVVLKLFTVESLKQIQGAAGDKPVDGEAATDNEQRNLKKSSPNLQVVDGNPIPRSWLEQFSSKKPGNIGFGIPLEEVDDFYENTYVVVGHERSSKVPILYRFNAQTPGHPLSPLNIVRRYATIVLTHWIFALFLQLVVLLNFFFLCTSIPNDIPILGLCIEIVFLLIYTAELLIRVIAKGCFKGPFTCAWSFWFWLDILIIIFGISGLVFHNPVFLAFAGIRLLKIVQNAPCVKNYWNFLLTIVNTLLYRVLPVALIFTFTFTLIGLQIYNGALKNKCILNYTMSHDGDSGTPESRRYFYNISTHWLKLDSEAVLCGVNAACPEGYVCVKSFGPSPDDNYTNFDSFSWSLLSILRIISQDYVERIFQLIFTVLGQSHIIFFILIFFTISFPFLSFTIAIIAKYFHEYEQAASEADSEIPKRDPERPAFASECCDKSCRFICWNPSESTQKFARSIVSRPIFEMLITTVLVLDIFTMSLTHFEMSNQLGRSISVAAAIYKLMYVIEFILKYMASGSLKSYFQTEGNTLAFIVLPGIILQPFLNFTPTNQLSLFRLLRLAYKWNSLGLIFKLIGTSITSYWPVFMFIAMYLAIFAHVGTTLYASAYLNVTTWTASGSEGSSDDIPRWNFVDLWHSFTIIFRLLCGEWIETLWDCFSATEEIHKNSATTECYLFYLFAILVGNFLVLCASIGIVLTTIRTLHHKKLNPRTKSHVEIICKSICLPVDSGSKTGTGEGIEMEGPARSQRPNAVRSQDHENDVATADNAKETGTGLGTPGTCWSRFRAKIALIRSTKLYHAFSIVLIIIVSLVYVGYSSHDAESNPKYFKIRSVVSKIFNNWLLCIEVPFKLVQFGCKGFFTSFGCVLDLVVGLAFVIQGELSNKIMIIIILAYCRPFLLVDRLKRLQCVSRGLYRQICLIKRYAFAGAFIWLLFGLEGVWIFAGKFYMCETQSYGHENAQDLDKIRTRRDCENIKNATWRKPDFNFDDIGESLLSLSFVSVFSGWITIIQQGIYSTAGAVIYDQPVGTVNYSMMLYFIAFIVIGVFFLVNIIIGIFVYNLEQDETRLQFLSDKQKTSYRTQLDALKTSSPNTPAKSEVVHERGIIPEPIWKLNKILYSIVTNIWFEKAILGVIMFDVLLSSCHSYDQSSTEALILHCGHYIVILIYFIEMIIKILAWRRHYFTTRWNIFDFVVIILLLLGLVLRDHIEAFAINPAIFRVFRLARLYRLMDTTEFSEPAENKKRYERPTTPEKTKIQPLQIHVIFRKIYNIVTNFEFDAFIMVVILLDYFEIHFNSKHMSNFEQIFCLILVPTIYLTELVLKLIAWRQYYFTSIWNIIDFLAIVGITLRRVFGLGWTGENLYVLLDIILVLETLRILRILRFIPIWQYGIWFKSEIMSIHTNLKLQTLKRAFIFSFPTIANLLSVFLILIFTYSFFGIALFGDVKIAEDIGLDDMTGNFRSFPNAFITLIRLTCFAGVEGVYFGISNTWDCETGDDGEITKNFSKCENSFHAKCFLITYLAASGLIFLNVYLALILETINQLSISGPPPDESPTNYDNGAGGVTIERSQRTEAWTNASNSISISFSSVESNRSDSKVAMSTP